MIINTNYRMGSYIDLCRCPCNNGCWLTSSPCCPQPYPSPCSPYPVPCSPCPAPCSSFDCVQPCDWNCNKVYRSPSNCTFSQNALFFLAGYMLNKKR